MRYLGLGVLIYAFISITGLVFVALLLTSFYIKKKVCKMDEEKWDLYFKSMSDFSYIVRFWLVYFISLLMVSIVEYYILVAFDFKDTLILTVITIMLGIIKMVFKFRRNMSEFLGKIEKLRKL